MFTRRAPREEHAGSPRRRRGRKPKHPPGVPKPTAQRNSTDPESRIRTGHDGFVQAYNAQAAVDAKAQAILAHRLANNAAGHDALGPRLDALAAATDATPAEVSADGGSCSEANLADLAGRGIRGHVATGRAKHPNGGEGQRRGPPVSAMRQRPRRAGRRSRCR